ncbi:MAG: hypothetical protein LLG02_02770 [Pelosinus sp.]|nr:hypothetical protein [Pelosinus sp.]
MLTSTIVAILIFLCFLFFIIYKRDVLMRIFTIDAALPANELQEQLERTADTVVRRLEDKIGHLEYLLDEADTKIQLLEKYMEAAPQKEEEVPQSIVPPAPMQVMTAYKSNQNVPERTTISTISEVPEPVALQSETGDQSDKKRVVLSMAEQGYNVTEIAKVLGLGKGEVMLLLQLNKAGK